MTVRIITDSNGRKHITNEPLLHQPAPVQSCYCPNCEAMGKELAALKAQPAPVQEPVAWGIIASNTGRICQVELDADEIEGHNSKHIVPLYTTPPAAQRQWVGLTDEQFQAIRSRLSRQDGWDGNGWDLALKEAIEAKLKEKNT